MPGQGEIGGGSCYVDFKVKSTRTAAQKEWSWDDASGKHPFTLTIDVVSSAGGTLAVGQHTVVLDSGNKVTFNW